MFARFAHTISTSSNVNNSSLHVSQLIAFQCYPSSSRRLRAFPTKKPLLFAIQYSTCSTWKHPQSAQYEGDSERGWSWRILKPTWTKKTSLRTLHFLSRVPIKLYWDRYSRISREAEESEEKNNSNRRSRVVGKLLIRRGERYRWSCDCASGQTILWLIRVWE